MKIMVNFKTDQLCDPGLCAPEKNPVPTQKNWVAAWEQCLGVGEIALRLSATFGWLMVFMKLRFPGV